MIEIFRGDSKTIKVSVTNNGAVMDLTGYVAKLTVKASEKDADYLMQAQVANIENPTAGIIVFELKPTDTDITHGHHVYDIEIRKGTGDDLKVYTVAMGEFKVNTDIG